MTPHLCLLMLAIAREFVQKQEAINIAGQEVGELCRCCSRTSLRGFRMKQSGAECYAFERGAG